MPINSTNKKKVILITGHYWNSKRKAGFHWIGEAFAKAGWEVLFFTASISWMSYLRSDYRLEYPVRGEAGKIINFKDNISSFVWFTPFHPANLRLSFLNKISTGFFNQYSNLSLGEAENFISESDLFIFESTPGLYLFERFKKLNDKAKFVYRVSDDLRLLKVYPGLIELENKIIPQFDLVSVPSNYIFNLFKDSPNVKLHYHGIQKNMFNQCNDNPYLDFKPPNIVFMGNSFFDIDFIERATLLFPEYNFHLIGDIPNLPKRTNLFKYGELKFKKTIPYIKYSDLGLQMRSYSPGAESLTDSLKMIQYRYCKLPIVAPSFMKREDDHVFYYTPNDDVSIKKAISDGLKYNRNKISTSQINSWDDLGHLLGS